MEILNMIEGLFLSYYDSYMMLMLIHALVLLTNGFCHFIEFCPSRIAIGDRKRRQNIFVRLNAWVEFNDWIVYPLEIDFQ